MAKEKFSLSFPSFCCAQSSWQPLAACGVGFTLMRSGLIAFRTAMGEYTIRYLFVVLPLFSVFIVFLLRIIFGRIFRRSGTPAAQRALILFIAVMILCSNVFQDQVLLKLNQDSVGVPLSGKKTIVANIDSCRDHAFAYFYLDTEAVFPMDQLDSRFGDALAGLEPDEEAIFLVHEELASVEKINRFLSETPGISFCYLTSSQYPLDINDLYHVYQISIDPV